MTQTSKIAELDQSIADNTKLVELAKALSRLESNRDFKKIIGEGYFTQEAVRLVHAKADPAFGTPERQASIIRQMDSIGNLADYFRTVRSQGEIAQKSVDDAYIDRAEIVRLRGDF